MNTQRDRLLPPLKRWAILFRSAGLSFVPVTVLDAASVLTTLGRVVMVMANAWQAKDFALPPLASAKPDRQKIFGSVKKFGHRNMCRSYIILLAVALSGCGGKKERVAVDGHEVQLRLEGRGSPTVVFESGAGSGLATWTKVQPKVARFASTIAYDRAGLGKSEPGLEPRDARRIARELHTALQKVGAQPPYVLVGHSSGAFYIRLFADEYPEEVAGLVFVDPATEQMYDWFKIHVPDAVKDKVDSSKMPPGARAEWQAQHVTTEQVRSTRLPTHLPTVVLSSTRSEPNHLPGFLEALLTSHEELVNKLPNAKHVLTENSGHNIQGEQPQLVVEAVQEIIQQISHRKP